MKQTILGMSAGAISALGLVAFGVSDLAQRASDSNDPRASYVVRAASSSLAALAIASYDGTVVGELPAIAASSAMLTESQAAALRAAGMSVYKDGELKVSGQVPETYFPAWVGADQLHAAGIDGSDIGIAIIDTGLWPKVSHELGVRAGVSTVGWATNDSLLPFTPGQVRDNSGHGTHLASIAAGREATSEGLFEGVAPGADVIVVRSFNADGYGTYVDVIEGIQWVIDHREQHNIRVLNLSFSADPQSYYWDDPINQAVMAAWQAGIVVVTSSGNTGPDPMTVGVPGNVPYVITVGSVDDNFTPADYSDDFLSSFSSTGPTYEGFVKPEVTAPGGHMLAHMHPHSRLSMNYPEYRDRSGQYFTMSGTSQSAAVISGIAALVLQSDPTLSPDDVKCRLLAAAKPVVNEGGLALYSFFQQGAGLVFAPDAVYGQQLGCANRGLDVAADLAGDTHYIGAATQLDDGSFALRDPVTQELFGGDAAQWDGSYAFAQGYTWSGGDTGGTTDGYTWSGGDTGGTTDGYTWSGGDTGGTTDGYTWSGGDTGGTTDGYTWSGGDTGGTTDFMPNLLNLGVNDWVIPDSQRQSD